MKPPIPLIAKICLFVPISTFLADDHRPRGDEYPCPQTTSTWTLYPDSSPGAPDFWWKTDALPVREMCICDHGVQFLFTAVQEGQPRPTALVFPNPSRPLLAERLELEPGGERLEKEFEHFRGRYTALLEELARISSGTLVKGTPRRFPPGDEGEAPTLVANTRLVLCWRGEELKLRGYLDVYFGEPPVQVAAESLCGRGLDEHGGVPDGVTLVSASRSSGWSPRVAPNPGGAGSYMISYGLPTSGPVELALYNVTGRRVATLMNGPQQAGRQRLRWSGQTSRGTKISPGVYFVRLTTREGVRATKFVHLGR